MTDFLVDRFPAISRAVWLARMAAGEVIDEHGVPVTPERPHRTHLRLYYYRTLGTEPNIPIAETILHHDAHLLVVDKPHFLTVTPSGPYLQQSLLVRLRRRLGIEALAPLHRLDRDTAGVLLFSTNAASRGAYQSLFARRAIDKRYEAIVSWRADLDLPQKRISRIVADTRFPLMCEAPGAANAETHFEWIESRGRRAHLLMAPVTGRKHQLRVHCAALGLPIVNDRLYPRLHPPAPDDHAAPLQLLARTIGFVDPLTGMRREFTSARSLAFTP